MNNTSADLGKSGVAGVTTISGFEGTGGTTQCSFTSMTITCLQQ
jgi:hypothetical protein